VRVRGKASVRHRSIPTASADNAVRGHAQASPKGATRTVRLGVATLGKDGAIAGDPRLDPDCSGGSVCREIRVRVSICIYAPSQITSMSLLKPLFYLLVSLLISSCTTVGINSHKIADGDSFPADEAVSQDYPISNNGILRILTLNIAHGRNQAANQLLLEKEDIEQNIRSIARMLKKTNADVVALQEADGPSGWSGNFDHIELLAREAGYPWYYRANHAESWLFSYGTAILSRLPVAETIQHTFSPSPPTLNKGFLLGQVNWMNDTEIGSALAVDIVSVHLDFSRQRVRDEQIAEMTEALANRENPMIILGDFNSEWFAEESVVKELAEKSRLSVYQPDAIDLHTYNSKRRYDWILISDEFAFVRYEVLPDIISDHLAVLAVIKLKKSTESSAENNLKMVNQDR